MHLLEFAPVLGALRYSPQKLMMIGAVVTVLISLLTFSNWRLGVKIAFVMVLFEGAIRKWALPQAQELAYFIKDIFLIGAYLRFFFFPEPSQRAWKIQAPSGLVILCCTLISFSALNPNIGSWILSLYGLKIYLFYIPLAFMLPHLFRDTDDMIRNLFWYAMLAMPICLLGIAQFAAPGYSWLNVYAQTTDEMQITTFIANERVRITGTFSYLTGHTCFVIIFSILHLGLLTTGLPKLKWVLLLANLPLLLANALMGGSRASLAGIGLAVVGFLVLSTVQRLSSRANALLIVSLCVGVTLAAVSLLFRDAKESFMGRVMGSTDSFYHRAVGMTASSLSDAVDQAGVFGFGIGMTHLAVERLRGVFHIPRPKAQAPVYDNEFGQVYAELGMIGFGAWYFLRIMIFFHSISVFLRAPPSDLKAMMLASVLIQGGFFFMGLVFNHAANFLVFGTYGLCLMACKTPALPRRLSPAAHRVRFQDGAGALRAANRR